CDGSKTFTPSEAGRRIDTSRPVGEEGRCEVGSIVRPGPKGSLLQPPMAGNGTSAVSKRSGSTQLAAPTVILSGTPQRVGLVRNGSSRVSGERESEVMQPLNASWAVQRSVS